MCGGARPWPTAERKRREGSESCNVNRILIKNQVLDVAGCGFAALSAPLGVWEKETEDVFKTGSGDSLIISKADY